MTNEELQQAFERLVRERRLTAPVPRERIWDELEREPRVLSRKPRSRWLRIPALAFAASVLLATGGIGIGWRVRHARRPPTAIPVADQHVVARHLVRADSAIRGFEDAVARRSWTDQMTAGARDLELATRRIQGGRIAVDSATAGLLADVDFVLTEIAGYGDLTADRGAESEMIDYSIQLRGVIRRLSRLGDATESVHDTAGAVERVGERTRELGASVLGFGVNVLTPSVAQAATPAGDWAADSSYRAGRDALARRDYYVAADLFARVVVQHPSAAVVGSARYWRGYSLYVSGKVTHSLRDLRGAQEALDGAEQRYSPASTAREGPDLRARVIAAEATLGDAGARGALDSAVTALDQPLSCGDMDLSLKLVALERLIDRDPAGAMPTIKRVLSMQGPCAEEVRHATLVVIANTPGMNATSIMDASKAAAQTEPPIHDLGRLVGQTATPLRSVWGVREIAGGKVLVNDWGSHRLLLLDSTLTSVVTLLDTSSTARRRYVMGGQFLWPFTGGTTLYYDAAAESFVVISASGDIDRVIARPPMDNPTMLLDISAHHDGIDALGRLVYRGLPQSTVTRSADGLFARIAVADSGVLLAVGWTARPIDTLAKLKFNVPQYAQPRDIPAGAVVGWNIVMNPLQSADDWVVTPSGAVAILRTGSFRIEWLNEDGSKTVTPPLPIEWHRLTDSAKAALVDSALGVAEANKVQMRDTAGHRNVLVTRPVPEADALPDYPPPFVPGTTLADAEGNVWVLPAATHDSLGKVYSVVNRAGTVTSRVRIPNGFTIAGFGPGVVYLTVREGTGTVVAKYRIR